MPRRRIREPADLHAFGTLSNIVRYITAPDGSHHLVCQGEQRFRVTDFLEGLPFLVARVIRIPEPESSAVEVEARFLNLRERALEAIQLLPQAPAELIDAIRSMASPGALADLVTAYMDATPEEKQEILETIDLVARMDKVSRLLAHRIEVLRISQEIGQQTKAALDERQREVLLREQMAAIQRQLGEGDSGKAQEIAELTKAIAKAGMPKEVEEQARKELRRLERMPEAAAEYGMIRSYLDWLIELPWKLPEETPIDISRGAANPRRGSLRPREDQAAHPRISRRAQARAAGQGADPVLRRPARRRQDVARPVDRPRHGPEIRARQPRRRARRGGDPRPPPHLYRRAAGQHHPGDPQGRHAQLRDDAGRDRQARPRHPGRSRRRRCWRCSTRSRTTRSATTISRCRSICRRVVFITTANMLDTIPGPLRDRMEVISLAGYTDGEKLEIARRYLVRRQLEANGLQGGAGLDRRGGAARDHRELHARGRRAQARARDRQGPAQRRGAHRRRQRRDGAYRGRRSRRRSSGAPRFENEVAMRTSVPGVATGLAWTPVGGDILFIEATRVPGCGKLILTGQLGEVMRESAQAALSLVKSKAVALGVDPALFEKSDIHVHVPAGAMPKDGPSAGVAMFMALASLLTGRTVAATPR